MNIQLNRPHKYYRGAKPFTLIPTRIDGDRVHVRRGGRWGWLLDALGILFGEPGSMDAQEFRMCWRPIDERPFIMVYPGNASREDMDELINAADELALLTDRTFKIEIRDEPLNLN